MVNPFSAGTPTLQEAPSFSTHWFLFTIVCRYHYAAYLTTLGLSRRERETAR